MGYIVDMHNNIIPFIICFSVWVKDRSLCGLSQYGWIGLSTENRLGQLCMRMFFKYRHSVVSD